MHASAAHLSSRDSSILATVMDGRYLERYFPSVLSLSSVQNPSLK
jgi:hypothetical protein